MDPNDDVYSDTLNGSDDHANDSPEPFSASAPALCDPQPPPLPLYSPPSAKLRRRSVCPPSLFTESTDTASRSEIIDDDDARRSSQRHHRNLLKLKEIKASEFEEIPAKPNSIQEKKVPPFPSASIVTKEKREESTLTTAVSAKDDVFADSADSSEVPRLVDSPPSNTLEYAAGFVIRAILFQIKILIWLIKFPLWLTVHTCMFIVDPFGTWRKGIRFSTQVLGCAFGFVGIPARVIFKDQKAFWNVAFRCGWGFLWSMVVCCVLFALAVSSLVFSGFVVSGLAQKPTQLIKGFNFDYTKQSPVAYVPLISCAAVVGGHDSVKEIAASKWVGQRVLPPKQNVQVTVSLEVPESGYNRNLGVFQIRTDFLTYSGKTIASLSQPCMLKFRSEPIRLMTTLVNILPLLTGYASETQTLEVKIRGFVEREEPTSCLRVTLEPRSEYIHGAGLPQIYDSSVVIEAQLPFYKRIIWNWKISLFIWIAMTTFFVQFLFLLVCCWPFIIPRSRQRRGPAPRNGK
ncbi:seipin-2-like [Arachis stenosperma]|uniref:seipin-2-like n=1 Tax=Arachis stenosperma TaxID=217475 RepID=UPI0025AC6AA5|nr:seipin-2-like [Arachis stenosperma]